MFGRVARFYGWPDAVIRAMQWRRLRVYATMITAIKAEEQLEWLQIIHPKDPQEVQRAMLRRVNLEGLAPISQEQSPTGAGQHRSDPLDSWMADPLLARNIQTVEKLPDPIEASRA